MCQNINLQVVTEQNVYDLKSEILPNPELEFIHGPYTAELPFTPIDFIGTIRTFTIDPPEQSKYYTSSFEKVYSSKFNETHLKNFTWISYAQEIDEVIITYDDQDTLTLWKHEKDFWMAEFANQVYNPINSQKIAAKSFSPKRIFDYETDNGYTMIWLYNTGSANGKAMNKFVSFNHIIYEWSEFSLDLDNIDFKTCEYMYTEQSSDFDFLICIGPKTQNAQIVSLQGQEEFAETCPNSIHVYKSYKHFNKMEHVSKEFVLGGCPIDLAMIDKKLTFLLMNSVPEDPKTHNNIVIQTVSIDPDVFDLTVVKSAPVISDHFDSDNLAMCGRMDEDDLIVIDKQNIKIYGYNGEGSKYTFALNIDKDEDIKKIDEHACYPKSGLVKVMLTIHSPKEAEDFYHLQIFSTKSDNEASQRLTYSENYKRIDGQPKCELFSYLLTNDNTNQIFSQFSQETNQFVKTFNRHYYGSVLKANLGEFDPSKEIETNVEWFSFNKSTTNNKLTTKFKIKTIEGKLAKVVDKDNKISIKDKFSTPIEDYIGIEGNNINPNLFATSDGPENLEKIVECETRLVERQKDFYTKGTNYSQMIYNNHYFVALKGSGTSISVFGYWEELKLHKVFDIENKDNLKYMSIDIVNLLEEPDTQVIFAKSEEYEDNRIKIYRYYCRWTHMFKNVTCHGSDILNWSLSPYHTNSSLNYNHFQILNHYKHADFFTIALKTDDRSIVLAKVENLKITKTDVLKSDVISGIYNFRIMSYKIIEAPGNMLMIMILSKSRIYQVIVDSDLNCISTKYTQFPEAKATLIDIDCMYQKGHGQEKGLECLIVSNGSILHKIKFPDFDNFQKGELSKRQAGISQAWNLQEKFAGETHFETALLNYEIIQSYETSQEMFCPIRLNVGTEYFAIIYDCDEYDKIFYPVLAVWRWDNPNVYEAFTIHGAQVNTTLLIENYNGQDKLLFSGLKYGENGKPDLPYVTNYEIQLMHLNVFDASKITGLKLMFNNKTDTMIDLLFQDDTTDSPMLWIFGSMVVLVIAVIVIIICFMSTGSGKDKLGLQNGDYIQAEDVDNDQIRNNIRIGGVNKQPMMVDYIEGGMDTSREKYGSAMDERVVFGSSNHNFMAESRATDITNLKGMKSVTYINDGRSM